MKSISKLRRDFLAALPAIGAHYEIEAELLLAGAKPVGWLHIYEADVSDCPQFQKQYRDRLSLDKAVSEGKLISMDIESHNQNIRIYAQPDQTEKMHEVAKKECGDTSISGNRHGQNMGYRRRDTLYFTNSAGEFLPLKLQNAWLKMRLQINAPIKQARRSELLEKIGIKNSDTYLDDIYSSFDNPD